MISEVESIAGELRASIRRSRVAGSRRGRAGAWEGELDGATGPDLMLLRSNYDVAHAPFVSHRKFIGRFIIRIKIIARELLVQMFERQSSYNAAAARVLSRLDRKLEQIAQQQERIEHRLDALEARIAPAPQPSGVLVQPAGAGELGVPAAGGVNHRLDALERAVQDSRLDLRQRA
jgi:hypothetical protein